MKLSVLGVVKITDLISIIGISFVAAAFAILIKEHRPELAMMVSIAAGAFIFLLILSGLVPILDTLRDMWERTGISSHYIQVLLKCLGVCYITQLASDACKDAGQSAIAGKVELAGKVSIIAISLPLFTNLIDLVLELIVI